MGRDLQRFPYYLAHYSKTKLKSLRQSDVLYNFFINPRTVCIIKYGFVQKSCQRDILFVKSMRKRINRSSPPSSRNKSTDLQIFCTRSSNIDLQSTQWWALSWWSVTSINDFSMHYQSIKGCYMISESQPWCVHEGRRTVLALWCVVNKCNKSCFLW